MDAHSLRDQVFKAVFSYDAQRRIIKDTDPEVILKNYLSYSCDESVSRREAHYITKKAVAVASQFESLDEKLDLVARGWTTKYMGRIELNILRLALFEILYDDRIPPKVAINEALELAKEYCDRDAPSFVNGILKHFVPPGANNTSPG